MTKVYRLLFWAVAYMGRPFGGIRPYRIAYWLQRRGFPRGSLDRTRATWRRDRWGSEFLLNPYYLLDASVIAFGWYDASLHRYLARHVRPGMTCLDVGANLGFVAAHLGTLVGPSGQVHAFEPIPTVRQKLTDNIARNGLEKVVAIHPLALSNAMGDARIAMAHDSAPNQGQASLVNSSNQGLQVQLRVETATIDDFVRQHGITRIDLMKIDIQGAEILLLEGGGYTFGTLRPDLLIEVSPEDLRDAGRTSRDLLEMIEGYGYAVSELCGNGTRGLRISADSIPADYWQSNVLCTPA